MEQSYEQGMLGSFLLIRERLESIYREKYEFCKAIARRRGIRPGDEDDVIQDTLLAVLRLAPQGNIQTILGQLEITDQDLAQLEQNLTALFVFYLKLRRPRAEPPQPTSVPDPVVNPYPELDVHLALTQIDRAVEEMYREGVVTDLEWEYWCWKRKHVEGRVADFAASLDPPRGPGGWIRRLQKSLFEKIARRLGASEPGQWFASRNRR